MRFVFCKNPDQQILDIARDLEAKILRKFDGMDFWVGGKRVAVSDGDSILCLGQSSIPEIDGLRVMGATSNLMTDYEIYKSLYNEGLATVPNWHNSSENLNTRNSKYGAEEITYFRRALFHKKPIDNKIFRDGEDILFPEKIDSSTLWAQRYDLGKEFHLYYLDSKVIKCGEMQVKKGFKVSKSHKGWKNEWETGNFAHPWVKTPLGGWELNLGAAGEISQQARNYAVKTLNHLGTKSGKVKIATAAGYDTKFVIISIDFNPIMTPDLLEAYMRGYARWFKAETKEKVEKPREPVIMNEGGVQDRGPVMNHNLAQAARAWGEARVARAAVPQADDPLGLFGNVVVNRNLDVPLQFQGVPIQADPQIPQGVFMVNGQGFRLNQNGMVENIPVANPIRLGVINDNEPVNDPVGGI